VTPQGCWEWQRYKNKEGYGRLNVSGRTVLAHRLALLGEEGVRNPLQVMHLCHNPSCINPSHLELGTGAENVRQSQVDGRLGVTLEEADVKLIYRALEGGATTTNLAQQFGVARQTIGDIRSGRRWAHLYDLYEGPTGPRRKLTKTQRDEVVSMCKEGWLQQDIADYFEVSQPLISLILKASVDITL
jgi:hypothetical protein